MDSDAHYYNNKGDRYVSLEDGKHISPPDRGAALFCFSRPLFPQEKKNFYVKNNITDHIYMQTSLVGGLNRPQTTTMSPIITMIRTPVMVFQTTMTFRRSMNQIIMIYFFSSRSTSPHLLP